MMNTLEIKRLLTRANMAFESAERVNFRNLWQDAAGLCRPSGNTVLGVRSPGEQKPISRLIDVGINSLNSFTAGVTSTLTPKGARFFEYSVSKLDRQEHGSELTRWLADCSRITLDFVNESNFFTETTKAYSDLGLIGTTLMLTEHDAESGIRFKTYYVDSFAFQEDAVGRVDTVYMKMDFTGEQLAHKFGHDMLSVAQQRSADKHDGAVFTVYHVITRRPADCCEPNSLHPMKKKFAGYYISQSDSRLLHETGFDAMPAAVCRWSQASNEVYGRSPAIESLGNLSMVNAMEFTKLRSAQRVARPQWLCPDDGSVRNLNNGSGGIIYWNASNPLAKPEQLSVKDAPQLTDAYIQQKNKEIEDSFFLGVWNPLQGIGKQATATEVDHRVLLAKQNLVPKIAKVTDELLQPLFKRVFTLLLAANAFPQPPEGMDVDNVKVNFTSSSGLLIKQITTASVLRSIEVISALAQMSPEVIDYLNFDEVAKNVIESNAVPTEVIRNDFEVKGIRKKREDAQQATEQQQTQMAMAEAYSATNEAPEAGSPADLLMKQG